MKPLGSDSVLRVQGLGKEYRLYDSARDRLMALFSRKAYHHSHWALRDVSFELGRGQCIGVIGDNGAGKSSLLKLLAGTLQPSAGSIERAGRVTAILELGAGFHPDFSGRENLYFGGSLIGIDRDAMALLESSIVDFSELGEAMDRPVKTYSSGMVVRLAFALVTAVQPELLIIDEALAVGDQHFQKKCIERITAFRKNGCTILFCSHSFYHVRQLCDVALWLDAGRVQKHGDTEAVLAAYEVHTRMRERQTKLSVETLADQGVDRLPEERSSSAAPAAQGIARIVAVEIEDLDTASPPQLKSKDLVISVRAQLDSEECPQMAVMLEQYHGVGITSVATHAEGVQPQRMPNGQWRVTLTFPDLPLHSGEYVVSAYLFDSQGLVVYEEWYQYLHFQWVSPSLTPGLVRLPHFWS